MQPTYIGVIATLIAVLLFRRSMSAMLVLALSATIFGAASAVNATALGSASIQPAQFLLLFVALRIAGSPQAVSHHMVNAIRSTSLFAVFAIYGFVSALLYPRYFAGQIEVAPLRTISNWNLFAVTPLEPAPQNITQAIYLIGTFVMLLLTNFIARTERRSRMVAMAIIWLAWAEIAFGVIDLVSYSAGFNILDYVRNANYLILDQAVAGFHRIQGTFSETSAYSSYGFVLLVFITELWLRQVESRLTGWTALALGTILFFSTSSSAYAGLFVYAAVIFGRSLYMPTTVGQRKALVLATLVMLAVAIVFIVAAAMPTFIDRFGGVLADMTTNKRTSASGRQRAFWVQKCFEAFWFSKGLGIGVGSMRSSSLLSAIAGSMGVVGVATFVFFSTKVLPFYRMSTYQLNLNKTEAVGIAAGWAAIVGLTPAIVSAALPDPGMMYAFMAGIALAWAPGPRRALASHPPAPSAAGLPQGSPP